MKKNLCVFIALIVIISTMIAGCGGSSSSKGDEQNKDAQTSNMPEEIRISALKGPTAMGMVKLMQDSEDKKTKNNYSFSIGTTDEMVPKISTGEVDIAAIPANLASVLYNNLKGEVYVLGINTLGVLYVIEKGDTIKSISDLKGKTIYSTGQSTTPEYALNHILKMNNIDPANDLKIEFKSEPAEIVALMSQADTGVAVLPQPFVTSAITSNKDLRIALNLSEEWDAVTTDGSSLITGVVIARKEFVDKYPEAVEQFLSEYKDSTDYVNSNVSEAASLVGKYDIVKEEIAEKAIPNCNITLITGTEMQQKLSGYLNVLFEQNPQSVGGSLPDEIFYKIDFK